MLDPCVPVWCWLIAGEDAVWFSRHGWAELSPDDVGFDLQDMNVCLLRCEVGIYVSQEVCDAEGVISQHICAYPVQCGKLAAPTDQGWLLCQDHQAYRPGDVPGAWRRASEE
jgi:hypothetical protein